MENLSLYLPFVALVAMLVFGVIWAISPKTAGKAAVKTVMFIAAVLLVAILLAIPGLVRAEEWQEATVNDSVEVTVDGERLYLVVYTTDDGYVLSYFDDCEIVKGTRIRVMISTSWETLDAEVVEEPEPIWFPSFLLMGIVAPVEKKFKRAQKMPPDFYLPCSLFDKNTFVVYFTNGKKCFIKVALPEALEYIRRASTKGVAAFVCAFVEEYKQQAVVACNYCDFLAYWQGTTISDRIEEAYKALTIGIITNNGETKFDIDKVMIIPEAEIKSIIKDKDDPVKMIVKVKYSATSKSYTFRCRSAHFIGDFVAVEYCNGDKVQYKNTEVTFVGTMRQSELDALAKQLGYKEIAELYCEQAIDTPEAWEEWGGADPRGVGLLVRTSAPGVLSEEEMRRATICVNGMKLVTFPPTYPRNF